MAHFVEGALNAYRNIKIDVINQNLQAEIGRESVLGHRGFIPWAKEMWGNFTIPFQVVGGFVFGAEKKDAAPIDFSEATKDSEYANDVRKYAELRKQAVEMQITSLELKIGGVFGLNPAKFSDGMEADKNVAHIEAKADKVILPLREQQKQHDITPPADLPLNVTKKSKLNVF